MSGTSMDTLSLSFLLLCLSYSDFQRLECPCPQIRSSLMNMPIAGLWSRWCYSSHDLRLALSTTDIGSPQPKPNVSGEHWRWLLIPVTSLQLTKKSKGENKRVPPNQQRCLWPLWICFFKIKFVHLSVFSTHITSLHLIHFPFHSHFPPPPHFSPSVVFSTAFNHFTHSRPLLQPRETTKTYRLPLFSYVLSTKILLYVCFATKIVFVSLWFVLE